MSVVAPPTSRRKRRTTQEVTRRLLEAAEREFRRSGYAGATTAAIAREADVTEAQLFRCFGSKADLFREAIFDPLDRHFADFNARHLGQVTDARSMRDLARLYITELQQFIAQHAEMLMSLIVAQTYAPGGGAHGVDRIDSLRTYFDHGQATLAKDGGRAAIDPKLLVRVSFAAVLANVLFRDWLFPAGLASEAQVSDAVIDFVIDGISANLDIAPREDGA